MSQYSEASLSFCWLSFFPTALHLLDIKVKFKSFHTPFFHHFLVDFPILFRESSGPSVFFTIRLYLQLYTYSTYEWRDSRRPSLNNPSCGKILSLPNHGFYDNWNQCVFNIARHKPKSHFKDRWNTTESCKLRAKFCIFQPGLVYRPSRSPLSSISFQRPVKLK